MFCDTKLIRPVRLCCSVQTLYLEHHFFDGRALHYLTLDDKPRDLTYRWSLGCKSVCAVMDLSIVALGHLMSKFCIYKARSVLQTCMHMSMGVWRSWDEARGSTKPAHLPGALAQS